MNHTPHLDREVVHRWCGDDPMLAKKRDVDCRLGCTLRCFRASAAQAFSDIHGCFAAQVLAAAALGSRSFVLARRLEQGLNYRGCNTIWLQSLWQIAQEYRHQFGETPSSTLQRSRISRHDRTIRRRNDDVGVVSIAPSGSRDKPSVAVLPLQNSAADPDCRAFGEYLAEGMTTALCRARSLTITVPKPSRFRLTDPRQCAPDVGARYLLAGRIAQAGNHLRVIIRLLDAETDTQIWGDSYDGEIKNLFELADRITESVMRAVLPHVRGSEIERARRKRPEDLAAYGLTMQAFPFVFASNPTAAKQALDLLY
jgi:TolB-like protein